MHLGRRLINTILVSFSLVIVVIIIMGRNFTIRGFSDALFIIGLVMFFFALITLTNATNIFTSTAYVFKSIFRRGPNPYGSYHQYLQGREVNNDSISGLIRLSVSIVYLVISWYLVA